MELLKHNLSEKDREEIRKQVDSILDSFSDKLSQIKPKDELLTNSSASSQIKEEVSESFIERDEFERKENEKEKPCEIDREIMFENAPDKNKDFIVGEKGKW